METEQEKTEQISESEMFDEINETKTEEVKDTPRDEKGRFAAKAEETTEKVLTEPEPEAPIEQEPEPVEQVKEEKPDQIPSWRLKEEADARRAAAERAEQAERQRAELEHQLRALQQQLEAKEQPQEPVPDVFENPQYYQNLPQMLRSEMQNMRSEIVREVRGNVSLENAKRTHGELFDQAWAEMDSRVKQGDVSMWRQVVGSNDPGETLVGLYKQANTFKEVDGDLNSWFEKKLEERLKDPATQAKVLEMARTTAKTQPTKVDLPPSLNKAPSAAPATAGSEGGIWEHTLR